MQKHWLKIDLLSLQSRREVKLRLCKHDELKIQENKWIKCLKHPIKIHLQNTPRKTLSSYAKVVCSFDPKTYRRLPSNDILKMTYIHNEFVNSFFMKWKR